MDMKNKRIVCWMFLLSLSLLTSCLKDEIPDGAELRDKRTEQPSDPSNNLLNGHEYVDLGLPSGLKWATCNIGANQPEEVGAYYAWGEIETKSEYTEANSKTYSKSMGDISGSPLYDVASAEWSASWRIPTTSEFRELINECEWQRTVQEGRCGYVVIGPNGKSLFFPAVGYRHGLYVYENGTNGYYWTSEPVESDVYSAYYLYLGASDFYIDSYYRSGGYNVRPVSK